MSHLGKLIEDYQQEHGSSERFIAEKIGVSRTLIGRWKRGDYFQPPSREILTNLARFLRKDYAVVVQAALDDTYYREESEYGAAIASRRTRRPTAREREVEQQAREHQRGRTSPGDEKPGEGGVSA